MYFVYVYFLIRLSQQTRDLTSSIIVVFVAKGKQVTEGLSNPFQSWTPLILMILLICTFLSLPKYLDGKIPRFQVFSFGDLFSLLRKLPAHLPGLIARFWGSDTSYYTFICMTTTNKVKLCKSKANRLDGALVNS